MKQCHKSSIMWVGYLHSAAGAFILKYRRVGCGYASEESSSIRGLKNVLEVDRVALPDRGAYSNKHGPEYVLDLIQRWTFRDGPEEAE